MPRSVRLVALTALAAACGAGSGPPPAREFSGAQAMMYLTKQVAFGPRVPGMPGHAAMAAWLDSMARARADNVTVQKWWHRTASGDSVAMTNVLAQFNPRATQRVLYLAHWDTRPRADQDATNKNTPIPGADDGGSGVAILLGVADALKKLPPEVGVDLLFVDGEDYGSFGPPRVDVLIGAEYYATHPLVTGQPLFAVLFDMVGHRNLQIPIEENSQVAAPNVVEKVWGTAERMGYGHIFVRTPTGGIVDDHIPLIDAGMRAVDLIDISNYPYWHTTQDTPDKESAQSLEAVGNVAVGVIRETKNDRR
ncbi:MAG: M28 family peptidase [Gemmatimonadales bacterium]